MHPPVASRARPLTPGSRSARGVDVPEVEVEREGTLPFVEEEGDDGCAEAEEVLEEGEEGAGRASKARRYHPPERVRATSCVSLCLAGGAADVNDAAAAAGRPCCCCGAPAEDRPCARARGRGSTTGAEAAAALGPDAGASSSASTSIHAHTHTSSSTEAAPARLPDSPPPAAPAPPAPPENGVFGYGPGFDRLKGRREVVEVPGGGGRRNWEWDHSDEKYLGR